MSGARSLEDMALSQIPLPSYLHEKVLEQLPERFAAIVFPKIPPGHRRTAFLDAHKVDESLKTVINDELEKNMTLDMNTAVSLIKDMGTEWYNHLGGVDHSEAAYIAIKKLQTGKHLTIKELPDEHTLENILGHARPQIILPNCKAFLERLSHCLLRINSLVQSQTASHLTTLEDF